MMIKTIMMSIAMIILTINIMSFFFIWSRDVQSFFSFCNKFYLYQSVEVRESVKSEGDKQFIPGTAMHQYEENYNMNSEQET